MPVSLDHDRVRDTFEAYSEIGATDDGGLHRPALSDADREARDQFRSDLRALDLAVTVDEVGNIFGRQTGAFPDERPVLVGSHLDSQPDGGRYDGQLGVVVALEAMRAFESHSLDQRRPLEIVNWTNEEGARFNLAPLGSGVFGGMYTAEEALADTDSDGVSVAEALSDIGYDGDSPCDPHTLSAHLELHIEQGPRLDQRDVPVGVVDAGVGMTWLEVTVHGESNHAGTTPMHARRDAVATAATVIDELRSLPSEYAEDVVLTVGELTVQPDVINVIPEKAVFTLDVRTPDDDTRRCVVRRVERLLDHETTSQETTYESETLLSIDSVGFAPRVRQHAEAASEAVGEPCERLTSWAGHDAMCLAGATDAGMLFVPSVEGVSHTPREFTEWDDILAGARVFAETVRRLASD